MLHIENTLNPNILKQHQKGENHSDFPRVMAEPVLKNHISYGSNIADLWPIRFGHLQYILYMCNKTDFYQSRSSLGTTYALENESKHTEIPQRGWNVE